MACLVNLFKLDQRPQLQKRQLPLMIEDELMMVLDLKDLDLFQELYNVKNKDLLELIKKCNMLSEHELVGAFQISLRDIMNILVESVPCVGCRRSVERLYSQLTEVGHEALDPLVVSKDGVMSMQEDAVYNTKMLYCMLTDHSSRLTNLVDSQPRSKKSKRCILHSWDLQKSRQVTPAWRDVWEIMHEKCRAQVLLIDFSMLLSKLENYLKKHRFCAECKTKVMKAYNLLVEDCDRTKEKGFVPALYQKIGKCSDSKRIHLPTETAFVDSLIARAIPELMGNRRERHAKTMEIAQEEVLTCIGICIYDRLHRIYLRLREEEFTCRVLSAVAVEALCRRFETAVEQKRGFSKLEMFCVELTKEEMAKQQKKEMKKLRKKRKKEKKQERKDSCDFEPYEFLDQQQHEDDEDEDDDPVSCECPKEKADKDVRHHKPPTLKGKKSKKVVKCLCGVRNDNNNISKSEKLLRNEKCKSCECVQHQDCGYSSSENYNNHHHHNNNTNTSSSCNSSRDGSEIACSDGFCDHEGGECGVGRLVEVENYKLKNDKTTRSDVKFSSSLEKMLDNVCDDDCFIPPEEIRAFEAKLSQVAEKRIELRKVLKNRFAQLCVRSKSVKTANLPNEN